MKIQHFDKQMERLTDGYGLSFQSAIDIMECVEAFKKYDSLPQAVRDSLQSICDMFGVTLVFYQKKRQNNSAYIILAGIFTTMKSTFLYHDDKKVSSWIKSADEYHLYPGANNILMEV